MADSFAKTFIEQRGRPLMLWPDPKINSVEQMRLMESYGNNFMKTLMTRFPGNPQAAMSYLPTFFARMMVSGKDGEHGEQVRKDIQGWTTDPNAGQQEMAMYNALQRGAMQALGIKPEGGSAGITEMEHIKPDTPLSAIGRWGTLINPFVGQLGVDMGWLDPNKPTLQQ